jgi:hypothetical protein
LLKVILSPFTTRAIASRQNAHTPLTFNYFQATTSFEIRATEHRHRASFSQPQSASQVKQANMKPLLLFFPAIQAFTPPIAATHSHRSSTQKRMFTGIVEEMGQVISIETKNDIQLWDGSKGKGTELVVKGDVVLDGAYLG